ncbi:DUF4333 domain-containing protein [Pseudonocardia spinosispora]|uniref:DUF4333 domain-containing protein n=1 Tax=Pseudonocardia spinosispora TaxID=103441 RepID=UPI00048AB769|nr:DUF4333 domain-containing protein [Pseudonocardia spinosispora]
MSSPQDPGPAAEPETGTKAAAESEAVPDTEAVADEQVTDAAEARPEPAGRSVAEPEPTDAAEPDPTEDAEPVVEDAEPVSEPDPDATPATGMAALGAAGSIRPRHAGPPGGYTPSQWQPAPVQPLGEHPEVSASDWWADSATSESTVPSAVRDSDSSKGVPVWLFLAAALILATVVGVLGFISPGYFTTKVLDQAALQNGVRTILQNDYRLTNVAEVVCPPNQKVLPGRAFECVARINNAPAQVRVLIQTKDGRYTVGRPA